MSFVKEAKLLQALGHVEPALSCKNLTAGKSYLIESMEKINSNYADEQVLIAVLNAMDHSKFIRVFLPSRIPASRFSDEFIAEYNTCPECKKMVLVYNGMVGRCIDVEFSTRSSK